MIELKHKYNGYTTVYSEAEAKEREKTGWKRCDIKKEWEEIRVARAKAAKKVEDDRIALEKAMLDIATKDAEKPKGKGKGK